MFVNQSSNFSSYVSIKCPEQQAVSQPHREEIWLQRFIIALLALIWEGNMVTFVAGSLLQPSRIEWPRDRGPKLMAMCTPLLSLTAALYFYLRSTKQRQIMVPPCSQKLSENPYLKVHWALGFSGNWELGAVEQANVASSSRNPFSLLPEWAIFIIGEVSNYYWTLSPW